MSNFPILEIHSKMKMVEKILHHFLFSKNPEGMMAWHFNACIQTALLQAYFLEKTLPDSENYTIVVQECEYQQIQDLGKVRLYNHAHVYFEHKTLSEEKYILDTTRTDGYIGLQKVSGNDPIEAFLKGFIPGEIELELRKVMQEIPWKNVFESGSTEYYTHAPFHSIAEAIDHTMNKLSKAVTH
jgi:hypothetical protein